MTRRCPNPARGFTLVESMLALAILEVAFLAAHFAVAAGQMHVETADTELRAVQVADDLMEEILALPYDDPDGPSRMGPEPDEVGRRDRFDNTDDFHFYWQRPGGLTDALGRPYESEVQGFYRLAWIYPISQSPTGLDRRISGLLVMVLVYDLNGLYHRMMQFVPETA